MKLDGLSVDQAPPISAPVRFFIAAPIFGLIAGILIYFSDSASLMSRYSMESIVITHVITIGFLGFIMLGALTQMLPVLVGARMPNVSFVSKYSFYLLLLGIISMIIGLYKDNDFFIFLSSFGLGSGFLMMLGSMAIALKSVNNFTATVKAISTSIVFATIIVFMGVFLLLGYTGENISEYQLIVANIHSVWAIFGFAGILIIGVAFQVLPMFYVAPKFKNFCKKRVVWLISTGLFLWFFLSTFKEDYTLFAKSWIAMFFWAFSTTVWIKLSKRRRPISDVTVWYWRSASVFLTLGSFLWIFDEYFKHEYIVMVAILIGGGFIISIMIGMIYKIIPFLVWFHLNGLGYMSIPTISEMVNKNLAKIQFILFLAAIIGFIFSFYMPYLLKVSAVSFCVSMIILEINILAPIFIYKKTLKSKPDFDMSTYE